MHFKTLLGFFLQPYLFAWEAVRNFKNNAVVRSDSSTVANSVAFLIWSHLLIYWLLAQYRKASTDAFIANIALDSQQPFFAEAFAVYSGALSLALFTVLSYAIARRGYVAELVDTLVRCSALESALWIIYLVLGFAYWRIWGTPPGLGGDPVQIVAFKYLISLPSLMSLGFASAVLFRAGMLRFHFVPTMVFVVAFLLLSDLVLKDYPHSVFLVVWHLRAEFAELVVVISEALWLWVLSLL